MKNPLSNFSSQSRLLIYIVIAVIATIIGYNVLTSHVMRFQMMTTKERMEDTASTSEPVKEDSIQLTNKKVPLSTYESEYSAEGWYADFKANKVAFDKNYNEQVIDIHGIIERINNSEDNCAEIIMKGNDDVFAVIEFTNCPQGKDGWSNEVINTAVGQEVHIRGIYSNLLSDNYEMVLYKCHIVANN